jgi:hypothetical protein
MLSCFSKWSSSLMSFVLVLYHELQTFVALEAFLAETHYVADKIFAASTSSSKPEL